eukprot:3381679-Lingulodinium_polyedra.AAC.1
MRFAPRMLQVLPPVPSRCPVPARAGTPRAKLPRAGERPRSARRRRHPGCRDRGSSAQTFS